MKDEEHNKQIKLDDNLMMEMGYPSLDQFISNNFDMDGEMNIEKSFELIASCIEKIYSQEEVWSTSDCTKKEVMEFLEQMNSLFSSNRLRSSLTRCLNYLTLLRL